MHLNLNSSFFSRFLLFDNHKSNSIVLLLMCVNFKRIYLLFILLKIWYRSFTDKYFRVLKRFKSIPLVSLGFYGLLDCRIYFNITAFKDVFRFRPKVMF